MKYLLLTSAICLALIMAAGAWADPDLVIYYSFDYFLESLPMIVPDESGKGHDGVVMGDVTPGATGKRGGAARFATGSYLDLDGPNMPASDIPVDAMTLCAWANVDNTGDHHALFNARANDQTWVVHPELRSNGGFRWLLRTAGGQTIFDIQTGQWTAGEWIHFAGVYSTAGNRGILYVNGEETGTEDARIPNAPIASDWGMGARVGYNIDNARPFTGLMDDFCIYKRALSQDEVREVMAGGPPSAAAVSYQDSLTTTWGGIKGIR